MNQLKKLFLQQIEQSICQTVQDTFVIKQFFPVLGGDINQAYQVIGNNKAFFVKVNHVNKFSTFEAEAKGLQTIKKTKSIRVPRLISYGIYEDKSFLILEFLKIKHQKNYNELARQLAQLHLNSDSHFGLGFNNFIGTTLQINTWSNNWIKFFSEQRIGYQLELLAQKNIDDKLINQGYELIKKIPDFFVNYQPKPSLIHGDLWQGNYGFLESGAPIIYDPACYYGDHEADLAMMELFGSPGVQFFDSYQLSYPIHPGYSIRKHLYNIYHILNHVNLFGDYYLAQLQSMLKMLLKCEIKF